MDRQAFGRLLAATIVTCVAQTSSAKTEKPAGKAKTAKPAGHCVHNCATYATCKGNGNNSCKGMNSCANQGLVPKECSSQKDEANCKKVVDTKKDTMCSWYES